MIRERLYLGDYASGLAALAGVRRDLDGRPAPFSAVVSLCPMPLFPEDRVDAPECPETEWLEMPIADGGNGEHEFEGVLSVALPFITRRLQAGNVLVHCAAGMSRSVSVVAAVLCERESLTAASAFQHVARAKARAPGVRARDPLSLIEPAPEFRRCLQRRFG
ncbi:MAG: dual specificity protein phosphatase family protein [Polyangiaceae bacterium]|nr:dual specificity protein phosphatase family protein [Polyangiaceae bacterium]MCW5790656.1 dual specificity protein phosphatase family protein [Polyangiaceae bacterium]